jgi:hypothetical protein
MQNIQFIQVTPEQLQNKIIEGVKLQLEEFKKHFTPKEPNKYLTRQDVAEMLSVDISTIHNMCKRKILQKYQISGRILFLRSEVEESIIKLT